MLPALTAAVAGALVAGIATMLAGPVSASSADRATLSIAVTDSRSPDARGDLERPAPGEQTDDPTSADPTTTTAPETSSEPEPPPAPPQTTSEEPPPADPPPASPDTSQTDQVVALANTFRQQEGCGPLSIDAALTSAAQKHASDMANRGYFSHNTPEGVTFDQRIRNAGNSRPGAENIARGADNAKDVMRMWMDSPGHRANILNCDLSSIGVGLDRDGFYWVQDFGY